MDELVLLIDFLVPVRVCVPFRQLISSPLWDRDGIKCCNKDNIRKLFICFKIIFS